MSGSRDIPTLNTTILKTIAKQPTIYITERSFERALIIRDAVHSDYDLSQTLVDYVTEAGRFNDDVIPVTFFDPSRTSLRLKNAKISGKYIRRVVERCRALVQLDIEGTFQVDDVTVSRILECCPHLNRINLRNCRKLTDLALDNIAKNAKELTALDIGGNFNMSHSGMKKFLNSPKVENFVELNISGLMLTDDAVHAIARRCPLLTRVGFSYGDISENALRTLLENVGEQLESLCIAWLATNINTVRKMSLFARVHRTLISHLILNHSSIIILHLTTTHVSGSRVWI